MHKNLMLRTGMLGLMGALPAWANTPPQVTNVTASQRGDGSKLVDVYYDLADADGDACTAWVAASDNSGVT